MAATQSLNYWRQCGSISAATAAATAASGAANKRDINDEIVGRIYDRDSATCNNWQI